MDTSAKRKWVIAAGILLVAAALGAACMNVWQDRSFQNKGKGYVVVIRIDGPIYGGAGSESVLNSSEGVSSEDLMRQFQAARKDPQAKAILVRIMDNVRSSGKPIIISMGDMCASAGYWLASKGNYIFASPATITGSIGVYMDYNNVEDLMNKIGVKNEKIKSGAHKDILSMYRPMTGEERQMLQSMVDDIYNQFVQTVADGRKMDENKVRSIADGRILTGKEAQDLGLVDAMGNYYDALNYAASSGGIPGENVPVKTYTNGISLKGILAGEAKNVSKIMAREMAENMTKALSESSVPSVK